MLKILLVVCCLFLALGASSAEKSDTTKVEAKKETIDEKRVLGKVKTIYNATGRPTQQRRASKGWHQVADSTKLVGGRATVTLNTSTSQGRQDVSFISNQTYRGLVFSLDTANVFTYRLIPLSGKKFAIMSSSVGDNSMVYYLAEGE